MTIDPEPLHAGIDRHLATASGRAQAMALDMSAGFRSGRVSTEDQLDVVVLALTTMMLGVTDVINDGSVPAAQLRGVEHMRVRAEALRAAADVMDAVYRAGAS